MTSLTRIESRPLLWRKRQTSKKGLRKKTSSSPWEDRPCATGEGEKTVQLFEKRKGSVEEKKEDNFELNGGRGKEFY